METVCFKRTDLTNIHITILDKEIYIYIYTEEEQEKRQEDFIVNEVILLLKEKGYNIDIEIIEKNKIIILHMCNNICNKMFFGSIEKPRNKDNVHIHYLCLTMFLEDST